MAANRSQAWCCNDQYCIGTWNTLGSYSTIFLSARKYPERTLKVKVLVSQGVWLFEIHRLQPTKFLCAWNSPGKNTGMGGHSLFQGIFLTQGSNLSLLHHRKILYPLSHRGSPKCALNQCFTQQILLVVFIILIIHILNCFIYFKFWDIIKDSPLTFKSL